MVGGRVIGIARQGDRVLLHCEEARSSSTCAVRALERRMTDGSPVRIGLGDEVWWQGDRLYWTPRGAPTDNGKGSGTVYDVALRKVGCAH